MKQPISPPSARHRVDPDRCTAATPKRRYSLARLTVINRPVITISEKVT